MRRVALSLALVLGIAAASPVLADEPTSAAPVATPAAPAKPAKPAKDDPNRIVCTREHVVGSNRTEKVCMTAAERQALRDGSARALDESRRPGSQSAGTISGS